MFSVTEEENPDLWKGLPLAIDGDEVAYVAAAGNEVRNIKVKEKKPFAIWKEYANRTEFYDAIGGKKNSSDFLIEDVQSPFSVEKCYHKVDETIKTMMEKCSSDKCRIFMGQGSPRDAIATVDVYKGNRASMLRPTQLKQARKYLIDTWGAETVDSSLYEADDVVSILTNEGWIGCTQDKDAYQTPGWLLKPLWSEPKKINSFGYFKLNRSKRTPTPEGEGLCFLAYQMLVGDVSDNYKPTKLSQARFGASSAEALLSGCNNEQEVWQAVVDKYKEWYPEKFTYPYAYNNKKLLTGDWQSMFDEYFSLAYMKRSFEDKTNGYSILKKYNLNF